jgi:hypothetical protein
VLALLAARAHGAAIRDHEAQRVGAGAQRADAVGRDVDDAKGEAAAAVGGDAVALVEHDHEVRRRGAPDDHEIARRDRRIAQPNLGARRRRRGKDTRERNKNNSAETHHSFRSDDGRSLTTGGVEVNAPPQPERSPWTN